MNMRHLERSEIESFWTIDRSEVHHNVYRMRGDEMILTPFYFEIPGWRHGQNGNDSTSLYACFDRGGVFIGMFDETELIGIAVVDGILRGPNNDQIQLKWLYVSRDYRGQGVGKQLFEEARAIARERGASFLYVSSTPTENTVNFYRQRGCYLALPPDPELLAEEPEDIHLLCAV
jgi:GNAT superfamily N-acetyltransferase